LLSGTQYRMLHLAPEDCFVSKFRQYSSIEYLTADLNNPAMLKMDITDIQYPDNYFDIILCSHVLEHIPDDEKAMRELSRVLNPGGWAILQVPILVEKTFEDPAITDPLEREEKFGQSDHVRIYGLDYRQRLEKSGFLVDIVPFLDDFSSRDRLKYGLNIQKDDIYYCKSLP
jgi:ubiquinone/menaquinone biosynthesis C-methylase UbiE